MDQDGPFELLKNPISEKPKRKRIDRLDPPTTNTRHHPRHNAKARRVIVRYVLNATLWSEDRATYERAILEKFLFECEAQRLRVNQQTIAIVRERKPPKGAKTITAEEIAVHVKAWAKPLPGGKPRP